MSALAFRYTAVDRSGAKRKGVTHAPTQADAYRQVAASGLTPLSIAAASAPRVRRGSVSAKELVRFTYQMSALVGSRIPLSDGLRSIASQEPNPRFRAVIDDIASRIEAGGRIAGAMEEHRAVFGDVYAEVLHAAEETGNLVRALDYLGELLERAQETRQQVRSALMYPMCIAATLAIAVTFLVGFVVPKFARMFEERGLHLPPLTEGLAMLGTSIQGYWWLYLLGLVGTGFCVRRAWAIPGARLAMDRALHRVPYLRDVLVGLAVSRFARVLGLCLSSGLGLIQSIEMASRAAARPMLTHDADRLAASVRAGGRLSDALAECGYLPSFVTRMLSAGEEAGEIPKMCALVSRNYDRESAALTKNLATVIEPVLIVTVAMIVLVVALAVFLPMWDAFKLVG
jgi:type II secretory pathway component PulF